jgi:hypothetical protein
MGTTSHEDMLMRRCMALTFVQSRNAERSSLG